MNKERIGIFGGSFDPIHIGHLIIASDAAEQMKLDRVLFIPAAQAPLKSNAPEATADDRAEMTRLAIEDDSRFEVRRLEIDRGGTSFSIDTAEEIAREFPHAELFWIIGGDQARQLAQWKRIDKLAKLVEFICLERDASFVRPDNLPESVAIHPKAMRRLDISSTEARERLKSGLASKYFLPEPVFRYIKTRNLYQDNRNAS